MSIGITHKAVGHLVEAVNTSVGTFRLTFADAQAFLAAPGEYVFALVQGVIEREIVRINIAESITLEPGLLKVDRGQGGTDPESWPAGSLILATTNADHYNGLLQLGVSRTVTANPNGVLTPLYAGEKIYQSAPAGCERWWKAYNDTNLYWDLITGVPCGAETYEDVGFDYLILTAPAAWDDRTDDTYWSVIFGSWNGSRWISSTNFDFFQLAAPGTWVDGYRPTDMRLTMPIAGTTVVEIFDDNSNYIIFDTQTVGPSGYEFPTDFSNNLDINFMRITDQTNGILQVTGIEFNN